MITQKEIAEILGISRTTVARVINGQGYVKKETKERVLKLLEEKKYIKNYVGSSLASKKKKIYSFMVNSKNLFYTNQIKSGIKQIKENYKYYNIEIKEFTTDINSPEDQIEILKKLLSSDKQIDGIIIVPLNRKKIFSLLKPYLNSIKIVSVGKQLDKNISHVGPDYSKEGKIAAGILAKILRNGEKVLVIDNGDDNISSKYYLNGFLKNIKKNNIEISGPFKRNGIEDSINFINKMIEKENFLSIYINRYAQDILKRISKEKLKDKKIITNGIGNRIRKLIEEGIIIATVADDVYQTGYIAGQIMFDLVYKNITEVKKITPEAKIIFLENL